VFHLNVRSLNKNSNDLYNFLTTLNLAFDVLVLSEIWNHNLELYSNLFAGYVFHYDCCATSHIGGIGVYVKDSFVCSIRDNLKLQSTEKNTVENIWIEINNGKCKYIIGALYRHPNQNIDDFTVLLDGRLSEISTSHMPCIIAGDINIDLCNYSVHNPTTEYMNMLITNNFIPIIVMPTRITDHSATIIDHIYYYKCKKPSAL